MRARLSLSFSISIFYLYFLSLFFISIFNSRYPIGVELNFYNFTDRSLVLLINFCMAVLRSSSLFLFIFLFTFYVLFHLLSSIEEVLSEDISDVLQRRGVCLYAQFPKA